MGGAVVEMIEVGDILGPLDVAAIIEGVVLVEGGAIGELQQAGVGIPAAVKAEGGEEIGAGETIGVLGAGPDNALAVLEGEGELGGLEEVQLDPLGSVGPTTSGGGEVVLIPAPSADMVGGCFCRICFIQGKVPTVRDTYGIEFDGCEGGGEG